MRVHMAAGLAYASEKRNKHTYAAVVRDVCGPPARWGLLLVRAV